MPRLGVLLRTRAADVLDDLHVDLRLEGRETGAGRDVRREALVVERIFSDDERATELGGSVLLGPLEAQGLRNAVIADPQGGVIAVSAR